MSHPAPSTPDDRIEPARSFQHYEVLKRTDGSAWELGRGTMGITYKAFDVNLCCEVALKVVNAALLDAPNAKERFVREARAAAALRHRNVASVYHLGNDGERFFYAMEFIDGETLDALVRRKGPLPVETALPLVEQVARALAAAERQGLVHRDIKPANIMVVHEDADDHMVVKVIDFGLARPAAGKGGSSGQLTVNGFVGTPQFASPEQLEEQGLDIRADIYSLGVTLWFLLTGHAPFAGSLATICHQHLTTPPPWDRLPEGLPMPVDRLLAHMLEKNPANRPQNAVELRREIDDCLDAVRQRPSGSAARPKVELPRRSPTGPLSGGRYALVRPVADGPRGRVFEGRDVKADGRPVTVTFLPNALLPTPGDIEQLTEEVRLIQSAPHPHLTEVFCFERATGGQEGFLVEEWINGGTLIDLLAARRGPLTAGEVLRLLGQAAAAADHAASRRMEHLDLAVHQVCLHFPSSGMADPREYLSGAMDGWPTWTLKIHPLGTIGDHPEMHTWAGDVTLVPGVGLPASRGLGNTSPGVLACGYMHALAALTYELLGGASDTRRRTAAEGGKYVSLPTLNEEANDVIRQVLGGKSVFSNSQLFAEELARASGTVSKNMPPPVRLQPVPATTVRATVDAQCRTIVPTSRRGPDSSVAENGFGFQSLSDDDEYPPGRISDRLTLVSGEPAPVGRWVLGVLALLGVFVLTVAGVWAMLVQRNPGGAAKLALLAKSSPTSTPARLPRHQPGSAPHPTVPPPLPRENIHSPGFAVSPSPTVVDGPNHTAASATPPASTTLPDAVRPVDVPAIEKLISVRVRSIPSGAEIYSEDKTLGTTPVEVELPTGTHELIARFDGWPETRETIVLGEDQARATVEIHLMPPGLVPGVETPVPSTPSQRPRRMLASPTRAPAVERRAIPIEPDAAEAPPVHGPAAARPEPEVRRALPPLTPFDPDGTLVPRDAPANPSASPAGD